MIRTLKSISNSVQLLYSLCTVFLYINVKTKGYFPQVFYAEGDELREIKKP